MSQHDYSIANQGFPATRADINNVLSAISTNNSGTSAPTSQFAGQFWIDTTSSTWTLYIHDGADDIQFATIDTSANTVNFIDSALDVVTDTTPQLGGDLDLNSNDITGTGNINVTGTIQSSGNITGTLATASQPNITSTGTLTTFSSTGIDDNATSTAITINSSEQVEFTDGTASVPSITNSGDTNTGMWFPAADTIAFSEGGSERMRINSSGYLIIGATSLPTSGSTVNGVQLKGGSDTNFFSVDTTGGQEQLRFINPNGRVGSIRTSGSNTSFETSSDYRLKENVSYDFDATTRLKQLKPARFNFIADADTTVDGFIAHEVQSIIPEAISGTKDAVDKDGNPDYQGIDQSKLVPLLVKTIQELEARITALETTTP